VFHTAPKPVDTPHPKRHALLRGMRRLIFAAEISAILAGDRDDRAVVELVVNPKDGATFDNDAPAAPPRPPRWHLPDFFRRS